MASHPSPPGATRYLPADDLDLDALRAASAECRGCDLYRRATQTVFGEGPARAGMVLVGEQPGDREDREGEPFVGPAGHLLRQVLDEVGIDAGAAYLTNAVKHYKWQAHGKVRLHKTPSAREVMACRPWLQAELRVVRPQVVVPLGATAGQALLGKDFRVTRQRGQVLDGPDGLPVVPTVHPSSILRAADAAARRSQRAAFADDLRRAAEVLTHGAGHGRRR